MRLPWRRRSLPELELVAVRLDEHSFADPLSWLRELPDGRYAMLLRRLDNRPAHAIAVEKGRPGDTVHAVRPKR